ncbi:MAG: glycosyltransferase [bacterium]
MKILVDGATLSKGGGVAVYLENILKNFTERNIIILLVREEKDGLKFKDKKNVECRRMPFYNLLTRLFYEHLLIPLYAFVRGADAIFLPKQYAPLLRTVKIITTIHDFIPDKKESGENLITRIYWSLQYNLISLKSDAIIFPARTVIDEYRNRFKNLNSKKHVFIPDGFDNYEKRAEQKKMYILIPSTIKKRKNIEISLKLANRIKEDYSDKEIVITGRVDSMDIMEKLKKECVKCTLLGYVSKEKMEELFNDAFVILYLSEQEGYGLPIAEAISLGKYVVAAETALNKSIYGDLPIYYNLSESLDKNYEKIMKKLKEGIKYEEKTRTWKEAGRETEIFIESLI